jgi:hypothetical protein
MGVGAIAGLLHTTGDVLLALPPELCRADGQLGTVGFGVACGDAAGFFIVRCFGTTAASGGGADLSTSSAQDGFFIKAASPARDGFFITVRLGTVGFGSAAVAAGFFDTVGPSSPTSEPSGDVGT